MGGLLDAGPAAWKRRFLRGESALHGNGFVEPRSPSFYRGVSCAEIRASGARNGGADVRLLLHELETKRPTPPEVPHSRPRSD